MCELLCSIEFEVWIELWTSWAYCGYNNLGFFLDSDVPPSGTQLAARRWWEQWYNVVLNLGWSWGKRLEGIRNQ